MRGALQPDGLGEFLQWSHQTGTLETAGGVTIALADAGQPLFSPFHPMPRSPTRVLASLKQQSAGAELVLLALLE